MISALFCGVSIPCNSLESLLLLLLLLEALVVVLVELRNSWIFSQAGQTVGGRDVRKSGLLQDSHGRRCVDGVDLPAHVEARRRTVAVVLALGPLVGAGLLKNLRGVEMSFPIHGCSSCVKTLRPASVWTSCSRRPGGATALRFPHRHRCVTLSPCDCAAHKSLVSLFGQKSKTLSFQDMLQFQ